MKEVRVLIFFIAICSCKFSHSQNKKDSVFDFDSFSMKLPKGCRLSFEGTSSLFGKIFIGNDTLMFLCMDEAHTQAEVYLEGKRTIYQLADSIFPDKKSPVFKELLKTRKVKVKTIKGIYTIIDSGPKGANCLRDHCSIEIMCIDKATKSRVAFLNPYKTIKKSTRSIILGSIGSIKFKN